MVIKLSHSVFLCPLLGMQTLVRPHPHPHFLPEEAKYSMKQIYFQTAHNNEYKHELHFL